MSGVVIQRSLNTLVYLQGWLTPGFDFSVSRYSSVKVSFYMK